MLVGVKKEARLLNNKQTSFTFRRFSIGFLLLLSSSFLLSLGRLENRRTTKTEREIARDSAMRGISTVRVSSEPHQLPKLEGGNVCGVNTRERRERGKTVSDKKSVRNGQREDQFPEAARRPLVFMRFRFTSAKEKVREEQSGINKRERERELHDNNRLFLHLEVEHDVDLGAVLKKQALGNGLGHFSRAKESDGGETKEHSRAGAAAGQAFAGENDTVERRFHVGGELRLH